MSMWKRRAFLAVPGLGVLGSCKSTPKLVVGAKEGVEGTLISEIVCQLLERKLKARIERRFNVKGSTAMYQALQEGQIDVYPEYSRIAFKVLLKAVEPIDEAMALDSMRKGFHTNAQADCLPFLGFQNTYTAVVLAENFNFNSIGTLSQAAESRAGLRLGCTSDFAQSIEGYTELKRHYKLEESAGTRLEPVNQLFFGLRDKRIDILITGSTDPRLKDARYRTLADDQGLFSPNRCLLLHREEAALKYPSILPVMQSLSGKIDNTAMEKLNGEVEINKRGFTEVAGEWLTQTKLA